MTHSPGLAESGGALWCRKRRRGRRDRPLSHQQRREGRHRRRSRMGQFQSHAMRRPQGLIDHLIGGRKQRRRKCHIQRLRGFQIDGQLEFAGRFDWQIGRPFTLEDAADVDADLFVCGCLFARAGSHSVPLCSRHRPSSRALKWKNATAFSTQYGGEGGIRTPDTVARMPHFECGAFNHSATSPEGARAAGRASRAI